MEKAIKRSGKLVTFGFPGWVDNTSAPLQIIVCPFDELTAEINPDSINWYFQGASFLITFAEIPNADFSVVADLVGTDWVSNAAKVEALLSEYYQDESSTAGNHLVIIRKYLTDGKVQTLMETITEQTETTSDCFSIRFVNCGRNTVMIDRLPLETNETHDVPGEANFTIETKFRIVFDDGTTGRPIVKKR